VLNIVDLSELGLERANTSRAAVAIMGALAEAHGYYDAGESLFVVDPAEAFIFHVLPDPSGTSAVWVAQRVPDSHVGVVANAFTVRVVDLNDSHAFLYSKTMVDVALATGRWRRDLPFDFTRIFSGPELGHKYASGRRMWAAFRALAPAASVSLSPTYTEYVSASHYPATLPATNVSAGMLRATMRNYYAGTPYDMSVGMAAGAIGSPIRGLPLSASPRH
jgi:dipeptidase